MKPRKRKELAKWYDYSTKTFKRRLKEENLDIPDRKLLCINHQIAIYDCLGIPSNLPSEEVDEVATRLKEYHRNKIMDKMDKLAEDKNHEHSET